MGVCMRTDPETHPKIARGSKTTSGALVGKLATPTTRLQSKKHQTKGEKNLDEREAAVRMRHEQKILQQANEIEELKKNLNEQQSSLYHSYSTNRGAIQQVNELKERLTEANKTSDTLRERLHQTEEQKRLWEDQSNNTCQSYLIEDETETASMSFDSGRSLDHDSLREQLASRDAKIKQLEEQLADAQELNQGMKDAQQRRSGKLHLVQSLEKKVRIIHELKLDLANTKEELEREKRGNSILSVDTGNQEDRPSTQEARKTEEQLAESRRALAFAHDMLEKEKGRSSVLQKQCSNQKDQLQELLEETKGMKSSFKHMTNKMARLQSNNHQLKTELSSLKSRLKNHDFRGVHVGRSPIPPIETIEEETEVEDEEELAMRLTALESRMLKACSHLTMTLINHQVADPTPSVDASSTKQKSSSGHNRVDGNEKGDGGHVVLGGQQLKQYAVELDRKNSRIRKQKDDRTGAARLPVKDIKISEARVGSKVKFKVPPKDPGRQPREAEHNNSRTVKLASEVDALRQRFRERMGRRGR